MRDGPEGMALPLILLILLALTALSHGTLLLARRELSTVWAFRHAIRAGHAVEASLTLESLGEELFGGRRVPRESHDLRMVESSDGLMVRRVFRWLDQEFFLLEGTGMSRGWRGERRQALVGWSLLPEARLGAFTAAFEVGEALRIEGGSAPVADGFFSPPEGWGENVCGTYRTVFDSIFPGGSLTPVGPLKGTGPENNGPVTVLPPLGLLPGPALLEIAGSDGPGSRLYGNLGPGCPGNGNPGFYGIEGSITLDDGLACGLMVVEENLILRGDARFHGLALVGGDLVLEGGAVLEGMARVQGGLVLMEAAVLKPRACPVFWSLKGLPEIQRPLALQEGGKVTAF